MTIELRRAFGNYATGVTVITTTTPRGERVGMTANSFTSLSLDPPLVLWSVARTSNCFEAFCDSRNFAVHVLHAGQAELARRFATRDVDRFEGLVCTTGRSGAPLLCDYLACFDCATHQTLDGGDHVIVVGRVLECHERPGEPLIFFRGRLRPGH
jgi:flavin reductase (DIM6/NTAB) family NADH-FMN oxidoreductase RutF